MPEIDPWNDVRVYPAWHLHVGMLVIPEHSKPYRVAEVRLERWVRVRAETGRWRLYKPDEKLRIQV